MVIGEDAPGNYWKKPATIGMDGSNEVSVGVLATIQFGSFALVWSFAWHPIIVNSCLISLDISVFLSPSPSLSFSLSQHSGTEPEKYKDSYARWAYLLLKYIHIF